MKYYLHRAVAHKPKDNKKFKMNMKLQELENLMFHSRIDKC